MRTAIGKQAVVIGAGMGGLSAAKALSGHFDYVTVLERDALPGQPEPRPGTPQARHLHALLAGGEEALARLFPGFAEDLEMAGAVKARAGLDVRWEPPGFDPFPARDLGFDVFCISRPLLELVARRRLERLQNVTFRARCRVTEIIASPDRTSVAAVRCEDAEGDSSTLRSDLVVDASGRGALTLRLLESNGLPSPEEIEIGIDIAYSSAVFEIPDAPTGWKGVMHQPRAPESSRGGIVLPIENNRWLVSVGGRHGDAPPGDVAGFMAFAKSFRTASVYDAVKSAKRVSEIARFGFPSSVRRRFEKLPSFPRGQIPIADAICRFNPVFGQGMSVAAQEACVLDRLLEQRQGLSAPLEGLASAFFSEIQPLLDAPWGVAENDFIYPQTRGQRPPDFERRLRYGAALLRLAAEDPAVHKTMAEVGALMKPSSALREQNIASRVTELMNAAA
jgi:2-polyprenyl-6-methoxyphenol hydroxylase-like FAD-dependent oxidoreductase